MKRDENDKTANLEPSSRQTKIFRKDRKLVSGKIILIHLLSVNNC